MLPADRNHTNAGLVVVVRVAQKPRKRKLLQPTENTSADKANNVNCAE